MAATRKVHGKSVRDIPPTRGYTTVSLRRSTYQEGKQWMAEHGYTSWEGLVRGIVAGQQISPAHQPDLAQLFVRLDSIERRLREPTKSNPVSELGTRERVRNIEKQLSVFAELMRYRIMR